MSTRTRTRGGKHFRSNGEVSSTTIATEGGFQAPYQAPGVRWMNGRSSQALNRVNGYFDNRETITDTIGNKSGMNAVSHDKYSVDADMLASKGTITSANGSFIEFVHGEFMGPPRMNLLLEGRQVPTVNGAALALARVNSSTNQEGRNLVALYECKDIIASFKKVADHVTWARARAIANNKSVTTLDHARKLLTGLDGGSIRSVDILHTLVGAHLEWRFGWSQFIGDIISLVKQLQSWQSKIDKTSWAQIGSHTEIKAYGDIIDDVQLYSGHTCMTSRVDSRIEVKRRWTYGRRVRINPLVLPSKLDRAFMAFEHFGLKPELHNAWEVLPLSFVVDWFLPVKRMIESIGGAGTLSHWLIADGCWYSEKTTTLVTTNEEVKLGYNQNGDYTVSVHSPFHMIQGSRFEYMREPLVDLPAGFGLYVPELQLPNQLGIWFTGGELLSQRLTTFIRSALRGRR